jgi:hypothetical protein
MPTGVIKGSPQIPLEDLMQSKRPAKDFAFHPVLIQKSFYN